MHCLPLSHNFHFHSFHVQVRNMLPMFAISNFFLLRISISSNQLSSNILHTCLLFFNFSSLPPRSLHRYYIPSHSHDHPLCVLFKVHTTSEISPVRTTPPTAYPVQLLYYCCSRSLVHFLRTLSLLTLF